MVFHGIFFYFSWFQLYIRHHAAKASYQAIGKTAYLGTKLSKSNIFWVSHILLVYLTSLITSLNIFFPWSMSKRKWGSHGRSSISAFWLLADRRVYSRRVCISPLNSTAPTNLFWPNDLFQLSISLMWT